MSTTCLASKEEGCESDVDYCSGNHIKKDTYAVDAVGIRDRCIPGQRDVAGIVVDYLEDGEGGIALEQSGGIALEQSGSEEGILVDAVLGVGVDQFWVSADEGEIGVECF